MKLSTLMYNGEMYFTIIHIFDELIGKEKNIQKMKDLLGKIMYYDLDIQLKEFDQ